MARIRSIHPDALKSQKLAGTSAEGERLYWRLSTHCDDEGRAEDDSRIFRSYLFPLHEGVTANAVEKWLNELADRGLIVRYQCEGRCYLEVTKWGDYQHPQRPTPSKFPEPSMSDPRALSIGVGGGEGDGGASAQRKPRKNSAHPIPDDWAPSDEVKDWAKKEYPQHATKGVLEDFKEHAVRKARKQVDWDLAFKSWIRQEEKFHPGQAKQAVRTHL